MPNLDDELRRAREAPTTAPVAGQNVSGQDNTNSVPDPPTPTPAHPVVNSGMDNSAILDAGQRTTRSTSAQPLVDEETDNQDILSDDGTPSANFITSLLNERMQVRFEDDIVHMAHSVAILDRTPKTYHEAINGPDKDAWIKSMKEEYDSLVANDTWEEIPFDASKNLVGGRWVYVIKCDATGKAVRFKSRYVAQGFSQIEGVDYGETYAPVVKAQNVRLLLAIAAYLDLDITHEDVDVAFLQGLIDREVYLAPPKGYEGNGPRVMYKLKRCIYGLHQSAAKWMDRLVDYLTSLGFTQLKSDNCIYTKYTEKSMLVVTSHVDDLLSFGKPRSVVLSFIDDLKKEFGIKVLGDVAWYSNMVVERERDVAAPFIKLHQAPYILDLVRDYGLLQSYPKTIPMIPGVDIHLLTKESPKLSTQDQAIYRTKLGKFQWATNTRPDTQFSVKQMAKVLNCSTRGHMQLADDFIKYLLGTANMGVKYFKHGPAIILEAYVDSDWKKCTKTRRSTSGYVFYLNKCPISWYSKLQDTVAMSSVEAEIIALGTSVQEALYVRGLLKELGYAQEKPTIIYVDNSGAKSYGTNPGQYSGKRNMRHIELRYYFIREHVRNGNIEIRQVPSAQNIADIFTKALPRPQHDTLKEDLVSI